MTRERTVRRSVGHRGIKSMPRRAARLNLIFRAFLAAYCEGLGLDELDVNPEVANLFSWSRVMPA